MTGRSKGCASGFSLLELLIALLIFQVGLIGVAGTLLVAQETVHRSQLLSRATLAAMQVGDSVLVADAGGAGSVERAWGRVSWRPHGEGGMAVASTGPEGSDTLFFFVAWPTVAGFEVFGDSLGGGGGGLP